MSDRLEQRSRRLEEATVDLFYHAANKPAAEASSYEKKRWHKELLTEARRYARAVYNLARNT